LRSQIPCRLFNYGEGTCEYGVACYYKHCDKQGRLLERVRMTIRWGSTERFFSTG
jgi:hypothetical protein